MKGGKNKNSGLLSDTETSPPWDAVTGVYSEKKRPLEVEEKEREGGDKEEKGAGDEENDEDAEIQPEELELAADDEKPKLAEGFFEIETVRRKRIRKGEIQYLIKWRGWPETANTWEPVDNLMTCYDVIDAFEDSLQSGKLRSTRKRKRTHGVNHSQIKTKQQQKKQHKQKEHSPADATYNVPAVKLRIIGEPVPSPPLASLNMIDHVDRNGSGLNNFQVDQVANDNDLMLDPSVKEIEEQNELHLKLNELKGVMATIEASIEKGVIKTKEASVENGVMATKESSVENGVMATKEASVDKGVVTTKEASVENRLMATKEASVDKGVVTTKEASVENRLMATKEASVDKGVVTTKEASVENGLMATKEASVDKGVLATKEASAENRLLATKEASVDMGVLATKEASVENGLMATKEASVDKGVMATKEASVEKGVMAIKEASVERGVMATEETYVEEGVMATRETSVDRRFSTANGTESVQSGRHTGAKRRKFASVRRFKQQATSGVEKDLQDAVANATSGHLVAFMQEEIHDHGLVGNVLGCNNNCDQLKDTYAITEIIKAESYSPPNIENGLKDVSVTFLAKRSDGKEVIVDNKFMKTNNPLLLISYYEKHLRHHPSK